MNPHFLKIRFLKLNWLLDEGGGLPDRNSQFKVSLVIRETIFLSQGGVL